MAVRLTAAGMSAPLRDHRRQLRLVVLLGALSAFGPLSVDFYLPGLPRLTTHFAAPPWQGQLTLTGCILGLAFGQVAFGPLSDRFGRRPPLLGGLVVYCAASLACALAPSMTALIVFRLAQGAAGSAGIVVARSVVRDLADGEAAIRLFSVIILVTGVVPALAPAIGGVLLRITDWRGLFGVLAAIDATILLAVLFGLQETLPQVRRRAGGHGVSMLAALLRDRFFVGYSVVLGLSFGAMFSYISGSSFVLETIYGVSPQLYGVVFGMNAVGLVACSQLNRSLAGRLSPVTVLRVGVVGQSAAGAALLAIVVVGGVGLPGVLPCLFVTVAMIGLIAPNATALALTDYPHAAGSASALLGAFQFAIGAAAAPLVGAAGLTAVPMGLTMTIFGVAALIAERIARRVAPRVAPPAVVSEIVGSAHD